MSWYYLVLVYRWSIQCLEVVDARKSTINWDSIKVPNIMKNNKEKDTIVRPQDNMRVGDRTDSNAEVNIELRDEND